MRRSQKDLVPNKHITLEIYQDGEMNLQKRDWKEKEAERLSVSSSEALIDDLPALHSFSQSLKSAVNKAHALLLCVCCYLPQIKLQSYYVDLVDFLNTI